MKRLERSRTAPYCAPLNDAVDSMQTFECDLVNALLGEGHDF
jgi:hypothetical protein